AANVAALAAAVGGPSRFIGQVGNDPLGEQLVHQLATAGVDTRVVCSGSTGCIVVLVDAQGERTMLTDRGAATQLATVPSGSLDHARVLHVPAYSLAVEPLATTTEALIGEAVERGIPVSVDASSVSLLREYGARQFLALVRQIRPQVFFCN